MKLVYLEWEDACDDVSTGWKTEDEVLEWAKNDSWWVKEIGYVIYEDKKVTVLASKMEPGNKDYCATFKGITRIPKTWIRKRINLSKYIK